MKAFTLEPLPYDYASLEPFIDAETMKVHHDKHHQAYLDKLNTALATHPELPDMTIEEILMDLNKIPEDIRVAVKNAGGGYYNHSLFWKMLAKKTVMSESVTAALTESFTSVDKFNEEFSAKAVGLFGSGWVWLIKNETGKLEVITTPNQDTPISMGKKVPLLAIDVWEHAYYLKYQNRRPEYISNWWNVANWDYVDKQLNS